jgi:hypothetical protein
LEGFCRKHGIAFDRHSDARYEYDGEVVSWRPVPGGEGVETAYKATQDGVPLVPLEEVEKIKQALRQKKYKKALKLAEKLAPDVAELPPLSFTDTEVRLDEDDEEMLREMAEEAAEVRPDATA